MQAKKNIEADTQRKRWVHVWRSYEEGGEGDEEGGGGDHELARDAHDAQAAVRRQGTVWC